MNNALWKIECDSPQIAATTWGEGDLTLLTGDQINPNTLNKIMDFSSFEDCWKCKFMNNLLLLLIAEYTYCLKNTFDS